jgi:hypothetical protein
MTEHLLVYLGIALVPTAAFYGARRGLERFCAPRHQRSGQPAAPQVERYVHHLRRLDDEYVRIEASSLPGRASRLRAVSLAYDDTLLDCCAALGLPGPGRPPLAPATRLLAEAELAQRGVTW